jgi:hypothetical protein
VTKPSYYQKNKEEMNRKARENYYANKEAYKQRAWKNHLLRSYGLTETQYQELWETQKGLCAICGGKLQEGKRLTHVDHDHETGNVRGLLCKFCNNGLGFFKDSPNYLQKAIEYLRRR